MNIIFVDDSKSRMEQLFNKQQSNGNKPLFIELLEKRMMPVTIFFGNFENEIKMLKPIGEQELEQYLDNYAENLSYHDYKYDINNPKKCIYIKDDISVDVNNSAFLLYPDDDNTSQNILQKWDDKIKPNLKYKEGKYESNDINKFLNDLFEKISNYKDNIVLIDMLLVIDDHKRFGDKNNIKDIPDNPILSMIIYHYLQTKSIKCAVYSTHAEREMYKEKWLPMYNKFFNECHLNEENKDFIIDRNDLNAEIIKRI
jgi:hypothetical protein